MATAATRSRHAQPYRFIDGEAPKLLNIGDENCRSVFHKQQGSAAGGTSSAEGTVRTAVSAEGKLGSVLAIIGKVHKLCDSTLGNCQIMTPT
jgi:hypothetical protein